MGIGADIPPEKPPLRAVLLRALRLKCLACGQGALYRAYLKPVELCSHCGAELGTIHAEDGPPWLTVLILGPFLLSATFMLVMGGVSPFLVMPLMVAVAVGAVLVLLPRVKAFFIGVLLRMGKTGA